MTKYNSQRGFKTQNEKSFATRHRIFFKILKTCGCLYTIWPLESASKAKLFIYRAMSMVYLSNSMFFIASIILGLRCCISGLIDLMKSLVEIVYMLEAVFVIVYARYRSRDLQSLLLEVESFSKIPQGIPEDPRGELKRIYLKRTLPVYAALPFIYVTGALIFMFSPMAVPARSIPLNSFYYGIPMTETWGIRFAYVLNVLSIAQVTVTIVTDLLVIAILWQAAYKFELVGFSLNKVERARIGKSVAMHQEAIGYAKKVNDTVAPIIVKSIIVAFIYIISSSLLTLNKVPFFELIQFFLITFLSCLRLLACSWSAENMTEMSDNIRWKLYDSPWYNATAKVQRTLVIIIHRCQRPAIITAGGFISALSLRFCGMVLYRTFSFFMTLRAILHV